MAGNIEGFRFVLSPLLDQLAAKRRGAASDWMLGTVGSRITGAEVGVILAYLASKVLGQYEIFLPPGAPGSST